MNMAIDQRVSPYAITILRIALGIMYLAHSIGLKYAVFTLAGTAQFFESIGLPGFLAYVVFWTEVVGGTMLILGIQARWVAVALTPILFGALWVHIGNGWVFSNPNGGWEYPVFLIVLSFSLFLVGDGAMALRRSFPLPGSAAHSA